MGSTIIAEVNVSRLANITVDDLDDLVCLALDSLTTLDFEAMCADGEAKWADGDPIQFDPEGGMAIIKINRLGLEHVLLQGPKHDGGQREDLRRLAEFVHVNGASDLYEFATF